jgi:hypothetical protein
VTISAVGAASLGSLNVTLQDEFFFRYCFLSPFRVTVLVLAGVLEATAFFVTAAFFVDFFIQVLLFVSY